MATEDCFDLLIDGPDIHCPKCETPMVAWNWGDQILYTCNSCNALGFNIERAGIDIARFKVAKVLEGAECKGCSQKVEKRESPKDVDLYTCSGCNVGLFANVTEMSNIQIDVDNPGSCANHKEMKTQIGNIYDRMIIKLR